MLFSEYSPGMVRLLNLTKFHLTRDLYYGNVITSIRRTSVAEAFVVEGVLTKQPSENSALKDILGKCLG